MRYVIMCGGKYKGWDKPKALVKLHGETLIERTTRLLQFWGVNKRDIWVSVSNGEQAQAILREVPHTHICVHDNPYVFKNQLECDGYWCDCFYPMTEPCTYLFGDVVFSSKAIETIVKTETIDIEFFASAPPLAKEFPKKWAEPFAFKVYDHNHLKDAQYKTKQLKSERAFKRDPIAWEFWQVVKNTPINEIDYTNYTVINDYTCDVDEPDEIKYFEGVE